MLKESVIRSSEKGLTLIEVLLSITILGIIATTFLSFFNQAYSYTKKNEDKTVGINVARNVLNYFEQQDFDKVKETYFYLDTDIEKDISAANCTDTVKNNPSETVFDDPNVCQSFLTTKINNVNYEANVQFTRDIQNDKQSQESAPNLEAYLIGVEITVEWNKQSAVVRGLIKK